MRVFPNLELWHSEMGMICLVRYHGDKAFIAFFLASGEKEFCGKIDAADVESTVKNHWLQKWTRIL